MIVYDKVECLSLASLFGLIKCLQVTLELTRVKHLSGVTLYNRLLSLHANIRLGQKGLSRLNILAYYEH